ncbi:MAG: sulfur carrier protein ThiS [Peptococcaceae bacterium]|jgi:thiamine biosynthesis protein ThiS|nr:sulfur carrier protein ThiS [Peptococcaceae bacterium]
MLTVNGTELNFSEQQTLSQLLEAQGYEENRIVVELNAAIIPKAEYRRTILQDGDAVEVLNFVGGG